MAERKSQAGLNARQMRFARIVAEGASQNAAFEKVYGKSEATYASRLARKPAVAAEIARLQAEAAGCCDLKREEMIRYLVSIVRTPVGHLDADHPLTQEWYEVSTKSGTRRGAKGISKLGAAKLLCGILGWLRPGNEHDGVLQITLNKMWDDDPPEDITPPKREWDH